MNREQRRKMNFTENQGKVFEELIQMAKIKKMHDDWKPIPEGTKVKLNYKSISSHPDWNPKTNDYNHKRYVDWIINHVNDIFTVEYDEKHKVNPQLLCLKEDNTIPKWLIWEGDLTVIDESKEN